MNILSCAFRVWGRVFAKHGLSRGCYAALESYYGLPRGSVEHPELELVEIIDYTTHDFEAWIRFVFDHPARDEL